MNNLSDKLKTTRSLSQVRCYSRVWIWEYKKRIIERIELIRRTENGYGPGVPSQNGNSVG